MKKATFFFGLFTIFACLAFSLPSITPKELGRELTPKPQEIYLYETPITINLEGTYITTDINDIKVDPSWIKIVDRSYSNCLSDDREKLTLNFSIDKEHNNDGETYVFLSVMSNNVKENDIVFKSTNLYYFMLDFRTPPEVPRFGNIASPGQETGVIFTGKDVEISCNGIHLNDVKVLSKDPNVVYIESITHSADSIVFKAHTLIPLKTENIQSIYYTYPVLKENELIESDPIRLIPDDLIGSNTELSFSPTLISRHELGRLEVSAEGFKITKNGSPLNDVYKLLLKSPFNNKMINSTRHVNNDYWFIDNSYDPEKLVGIESLEFFVYQGTNPNPFKEYSILIQDDFAITGISVNNKPSQVLEIIDLYHYSQDTAKFFLKGKKLNNSNLKCRIVANGNPVDNIQLKPLGFLQDGTTRECSLTIEIPQEVDIENEYAIQYSFDGENWNRTSCILKFKIDKTPMPASDFINKIRPGKGDVYINKDEEVFITFKDPPEKYGNQRFKLSVQLDDNKPLESIDYNVLCLHYGNNNQIDIMDIIEGTLEANNQEIEKESSLFIRIFNPDVPAGLDKPVTRRITIAGFKTEWGVKLSSKFSLINFTDPKLRVVAPNFAGLVQWNWSSLPFFKSNKRSVLNLCLTPGVQYNLSEDENSSNDILQYHAGVCIRVIPPSMKSGIDVGIDWVFDQRKAKGYLNLIIGLSSDIWIKD